MGSSPSKTNVQRICIDQTSGTVLKRKNKLNSSSHQSLSNSVTEKIRKSANSLNSKNSFEKERRVQCLQTQLENSEKRRNEAEVFVRVLQREMGELELRNNELFNEITWLKQQMGNSPMIPNSLSQPLGGLDPIISSSSQANPLSQTLRNASKRPKSGVKGVDMDLYKSLVDKLEMEQNNRTNKETEEENSKPISLFESHFQEETKISLSSSMNSQPLCRNLLSRDGYNNIERFPDQIDRDLENYTHIEKDISSPSAIGSTYKPPSGISSANSRRLNSTKGGVSHRIRRGSSASHTNTSEKLDALTIEADKALNDIDRLLGPADEENKKLKMENRNAQRNWRSKQTTNENLTNVFTLSDKMEPLRVVENNGSKASSTINASTFPPTNINKNFINNENLLKNKIKSEQKISTDESDFTPSYLEEMSEEEEQEVIDDILYNSLPTSYKQNRKSTSVIHEKGKRVSSSAKSHDSGYLEERISNNKLEF